MLSARENFLETMKRDGKPDRLANCFTAFQIIGGDPVFQYVRGNRIRGTNSYDCWGTFIAFPEDAPAAVPIVTPENQVIKDIERWKEYVNVPDLRKNCSTGWEKVIDMQNNVDRDEYLTASVMGTGIFEQLHMLMTFEDTLCGFLLYPNEMHELIEAIFEYRLEYMRLIVENLKPDAIISHDDWGTKTGLFMAPEVWRKFLKTPYKKLYDYLHQNGILVVHHADSYCEPIVEDMAEIGIDIWQGVLTTNNIATISNKLDGKMGLMGGIDSVIDREDASEEEIRKETRRAIESYGSIPHFAIGLTYGGPGGIYPNVEPLIIDEIERWNHLHPLK